MEWFTEAVESIFEFFEAFLNTLFHMLKDLFFWACEVSGLGFMSIFAEFDSFFSQVNVSQYFDVLPGEMIWILNSVGFFDAISLIATAYGIKLLMRFFPF